jgi:hypothetical protein
MELTIPQDPPNNGVQPTRHRDSLESPPGEKLFAAADMKYFLKTLDGDWVFVKNEEGRVTHIEVNQGGQVSNLKRIK